MITDQMTFISTISRVEGGTIRWMSPELLNPELFGFNDGRLTKESDCYALGMVIYEVLSGQRPFAQDKDFVVIQKVIEGKRPERPPGTRFTNELWGMLELCWNHKPCDRPSLETILKRLERVTRASGSPFPTTTPNGDSVTVTDNPPDPAVINPGMIPSSLATSNQLETGGFNLDEQPLPYLDIPSTPYTKSLPPTPSKLPLTQLHRLWISQ